MKFLQQAVGLRGYAQRDPLAEYKLEGYALFLEMNDPGDRCSAATGCSEPKRKQRQQPVQPQALVEIGLAALRHRARELQGQRGHKAHAEPAAQPRLQHSGASQDPLPLRLDLRQQRLGMTRDQSCLDQGTVLRASPAPVGSGPTARLGSDAREPEPCCIQALGAAAANHAHQHCAKAEQRSIYSQHQQPHRLLRAFKPG